MKSGRDGRQLLGPRAASCIGRHSSTSTRLLVWRLWSSHKAFHPFWWGTRRPTRSFLTFSSTLMYSSPPHCASTIHQHHPFQHCCPASDHQLSAQGWNNPASSHFEQVRFSKGLTPPARYADRFKMQQACSGRLFKRASPGFDSKGGPSIAPHAPRLQRLDHRSSVRIVIGTRRSRRGDGPTPSICPCATAPYRA